MAAMRAAFIAVGSELLGVERLDTNSLRLTRRLQRYGVSLRRKSVIGDSPEELIEELKATLGRFDLLVVSGGLGPTEDDLTRDCVARACDLEMTLREELVEDIRAKFAAFGRKMPPVNRRQAYVPDGADVLDNPRGTAPGLHLRYGGTSCFLLPGVPREFEGMADDYLLPWLEERCGEVQLESTVVKVACRGESAVEELIAPAYDDFGQESITVLASPGEVRVELWARGADNERRRQLQTMSDRVAGLLGAAAFTREAEATLESVCGELLSDQGLTVATAESCTGGLIAQRLTATAGSSRYFTGSIVAYANSAKELVGVAPELVERVGAVSPEVAVELARGARSRLGTDFGIGVTGIAGPGGGSEDKPVGTVFLALAGPGQIGHESERGALVPADDDGFLPADDDGFLPACDDGFLPACDDMIERHATFVGSREMIRRMTSQLALELLRRRLLDPEYRPGDL